MHRKADVKIHMAKSVDKTVIITDKLELLLKSE